MKLRCLNTAEEWQELEPQWNVLLRSSEADTIFLSWEWLSVWWATYGTGRALRVFAGYDGDELIGIVPFYVDDEKRWGAMRRCLRLLGYGSSDSDYLSFIVKQGREGDFVAAVLERLSAERSDWDLVEIDGPLQSSKVATAVREYAPRLGFEVSEHNMPCTTLGLPDRWEDYLQTLKPRQRTKVRSVLTFFEKQDSEIIACSSADEIDPWLNTMFDLHTRRWQSKGEPGVFETAAKRDFYRRISRVALQNGWLAFHRLNWCGRAMALQFGFTYGNRFYLLQEGYDPEFEEVRPGMALRGSLIRQWIGNGLAEYDFLGGQNRYKLDWGGQLKSSVCIRLAVKPGSQIAYIHGPRALAEGKEAVRNIVPERVLAWRKSRVERERLAHVSGRTDEPRSSLANRVAAALYGIGPVRRAGGRFADAFRNAAPERRWSFVRRNGATCMILQFHRVNEDNDPFIPATPTGLFRQQMQYLAKNFRIVSMDDIASGAAFERKSGFSIAITLDDGYRDNFVHAFPLLKEFNIPATIYLTTGYIEAGQLPWYDQVRLAFKLSTLEQVSFTDLGGPSGALDTRQARVSLSADVLAWLRRMEEAYRKQTVDAIFKLLRVPKSVNLPKPMLAWDEIREMRKHGISFGAHTIWHPVLASLSLEELRSEIGGSKRIIEQRLQQKVTHFAYPFGKFLDNGQHARTVLDECQFRTAVTTEWGLNTNTQDRYELRRCVPPAEQDIALFALRLDWYRLQDADSEISASPNLPAVCGPAADEGVEASTELTREQEVK